MGDFVQKKALDRGFSMVYVAKLFLWIIFEIFFYFILVNIQIVATLARLILFACL